MGGPVVRFFVVVGEPCFSAATICSLLRDQQPCMGSAQYSRVARLLDVFRRAFSDVHLSTYSSATPHKSPSELAMLHLPQRWLQTHGHLRYSEMQDDILCFLNAKGASYSCTAIMCSPFLHFTLRLRQA